MTSTKNKRIKRRMQIELLRAQAQMERQELGYYCRDLGRSVSTSTLSSKAWRFAVTALTAWRWYRSLRQSKQQLKP